MRAMGLDDAAIQKPMIGVVSMKGEQTPCNMTHGFQVEAAKEGVAETGGTPREFTTISVSDGISMNHEGMKFSLVSRELIADSIEAVVHGLAYDGLVGFGGCDKTLPGVVMAMVRCNVPSVFMYGGAALPGRFGERDVTILDSYEAVGAVLTGAMDEATLARLERSCLPTVGAGIRGGMNRGAAFPFEIHGDQGDLQRAITATSRTSMRRQELNVRGARGDEKELAELPIPGKFRWVPEVVAPDSRYNVAQLYARLAEGIRNGKPISPGFDAAVTRP